MRVIFALLLSSIVGYSVEIPGAWSGEEPTWIRCWVKVPDRWTVMTGRPLYRESVTLQVNGCGDRHEVWLNGKQIATADAKASFVRHKVPPGILKKGRWNHLAIRVIGRQRCENAPIISGYFLESELAGEWETIAEKEAKAGSLAAKPEQAAFDQFVEASSVLARPDVLKGGPRLSPEAAMETFTVAEDLEWQLVLAEPDIAQPLWMHFDKKGRLWVCEYRQYPYPAGVKVVSRDRFYRSLFDKVPPPPPHHDRGADRISVHEDRDGDGTFEHHSVFMDGLNMASSVAVVDDAVWVLHPPYLLRVPDANHDAVPDGGPEVHVRGFGLQDTHSVANSLTLGPDGWLYGAHGSTTASNIEVVEADGKAVGSSQYQEGAGVWRYHPERRVLELVAQGGGNPFSLTFDKQGRLFSGTNEGNARGYHYRLGAHFKKGSTAGKFGPRRSKYLFGALQPMQHAKVPRFTNNIAIYEGSHLPERFHGAFIGADPLARRLVLSRRLPNGSTFRTEDLGFPVASTDPAFRPVTVLSGPDGAIYVADFYEFYIAHGQHYQGQIDPSTGRIYRLKTKEKALATSPQSTDPPRSRAWRIRNGDLVPNAFMVASETNMESKVTMALAVARGGPPRLVLPMITHWNTPADLGDPHLPLTLWWAVERAADELPDLAEAIDEGQFFNNEMFRRELAPRLVRRYLLRGRSADHDAVIRLFDIVPDKHREVILRGVADALRDGTSSPLPVELLERLGNDLPLPLRAARGEPKAVEQALAQLVSKQADASLRAEIALVFGRAVLNEAEAPLLETALSDEVPWSVREACFAALEGYGNDRIGTAVLEAIPDLPNALRANAERLLSSRASWARAWLKGVEADQVPIDSRYRMEALGVLPTAGEPPRTSNDVLALRSMILEQAGNPYRGKPLYRTRCASCHVFFGQGGSIGPDLTPLQRNDLASLLDHIVNPSSEIREGYNYVVVTTKSGQAISGFTADLDQRPLELRDTSGVEHLVRGEQIRTLRPLEQSLMPNGLLEGMKPQQIRDLIAYLRIGQPITKN